MMNKQNIFSIQHYMNILISSSCTLPWKWKIKLLSLQNMENKKNKKSRHSQDEKALLAK